MDTFYFNGLFQIMSLQKGSELKCGKSRVIVITINYFLISYGCQNTLGIN